MKSSILRHIVILTIILTFGTTTLYAQKDTIITKQGDVLIGSVTSVSNGIFYLSTVYSNDPIAVKWSGISQIKTQKEFKIFDKRGKLLIGSIHFDSTTDDNTWRVISNDTTIDIQKNDISQISKYEHDKLRDKLKLNVDIGYIRTKDNNSSQLSLGLGLGYEGKRWNLKMDYLSFASQVDTIITGRGNFGLALTYILPQNWFAIGRSSFFSSTQQQLDLRITHSLGLGKYLIHQNNNQLRVYLGGTYNKENFSSSLEEFTSVEAFGSIRYGYYPVKGMELNADFVLFPSLTESGRIRSYINTELKFMLIRHFKLSFVYTLNYDNKPPVSSSKSDYILNFKFGWEL